MLVIINDKSESTTKSELLDELHKKKMQITHTFLKQQLKAITCASPRNHLKKGNLTPPGSNKKLQLEREEIENAIEITPCKCHDSLILE